MNRIILLGNGYDLSCNLKTKYKHFLCSLLNDLIKERPKQSISQLKKMTEEEKFFIIQRKNDLYVKLLEFNELDDFICNEYIKIYPKEIGDNKKEKPAAKFIIDLRYSILSGLLKDANWTDIEKFYFEFLFENKTSLNHKNINTQFEFLKNELKSYIKDECEKSTNSKKFLSINPFVLSNKDKLLRRCLSNIPLINHFFLGNKTYSKKLDQIVFVSFNYTTFYKSQINYLRNNESFDLGRVHFINIHGTIDDEIIFGYGNDENDNYLQIEEKENSDYYQHVKSFYYSLNRNYKNVIDSLKHGMDGYEVFCIGHSLGLSDKIMLKTIFSNPDCKNIRLFTYGENEKKRKDNFFESVISLSRHFENKAEFRQKLTPYDPEDLVEWDPKPDPE